MRFFILLALSVLCISASEAGRDGRAKTVDWTRVHELTIRGIDRLYSLEIDDAIQAFDSVSRMAPGDPRGPFFQSMVQFYLYSLNRDEKELSTFLDESERVIEKCGQGYCRPREWVDYHY